VEATSDGCVVLTPLESRTIELDANPSKHVHARAADARRWAEGARTSLQPGGPDSVSAAVPVEERRYTEAGTRFIVDTSGFVAPGSVTTLPGARRELVAAAHALVRRPSSTIHVVPARARSRAGTAKERAEADEECAHDWADGTRQGVHRDRARQEKSQGRAERRRPEPRAGDPDTPDGDPCDEH
jgi:hypothetical protein